MFFKPQKRQKKKFEKSISKVKKVKTLDSTLSKFLRCNVFFDQVIKNPSEKSLTDYISFNFLLL